MSDPVPFGYEDVAPEEKTARVGAGSWPFGVVCGVVITQPPS